MTFFSHSAHKQTRSLVERGIGLLKRRFHVLHGEVRLSPEKTCDVIAACAVLYNICKDRNIVLHEEEDDPVANNHALHLAERDAFEAMGGLPQEDLRYRDHFANIHFG